MIKLSSLSKELGLEYNGVDVDIEGLNTLSDASKNEIAFLEKQSYIDELKKTKAGAVLISQEHSSLVPKNCIALITPNPYLSMAYMSAFFANRHLKKDFIEPQIDKTATVHPKATIENGTIIKANAIIMAGVVIGKDCIIEEGCIIHPNVVIYPHSKIGKRCHLMAGCVIGSDGFGYAHTKNGEHVKIYHNGNVVLEDDVEIGANTTIDRGVFGETRIGKGTKIDNLVQIGHNVKIGPNCIMVSQSGLAGSTTLGRNVVMGGQSASSGHISIGDFATIAARGGVMKTLEGGKVYSGFPIMLHKDWLVYQAKLSKLAGVKKYS